MENGKFFVFVAGPRGVIFKKTEKIAKKLVFLLAFDRTRVIFSEKMHLCWFSFTQNKT